MDRSQSREGNRPFSLIKKYVCVGLSKGIQEGFQSPISDINCQTSQSQGTSHMASRNLNSPIKTELPLPLAHFRSDFGLRFALQAPARHLARVSIIRNDQSVAFSLWTGKNKLPLYSARTLTGLQLLSCIWMCSLRKSSPVNII